MQAHSIPDLAAAVKAARHQMDRARAAHSHGIGSYEEMAAAAQAYCAALYAYQVGKFGKGKRLDYRAVLR